MTGDERDHVVFKRDKIIGLHQASIVAESRRRRMQQSGGRDDAKRDVVM
jgi:hypothetical protein